MITFIVGGRKKVLVSCFDRAAQKFRLVNVGERTIASQLYPSKEEAVSALRKLESEGKIEKLEIFDEL